MYRILNRSELDYKAWDLCVEASTNCSIYGMSWYLDLVAPSWKGIVKGNYNGVFPIISTKKYAIPILFQPVGLHKVAWYSKLRIEKADYDFLIKHIYKSYAYAHINIENAENSFNICLSASGNITPRKSQILNISDKPLLSILKEFSRGCRYSIRKAKKMHVEIRQESDLSIFWKVAKESKAFNKGGITKSTQPAVDKLMNTTLDSQSSQLWVAYQNQIPVSVGFLVGSNAVLYFLFLYTIDNGLNCCANHLMTKEIIKQNYGEFNSLDFAGSNNDSIAFFNRSFGAKDSYSSEVRLGSLLPLLKFQHLLFK